MKFNFDVMKMNFEIKTVVLVLIIVVFASIFLWNLFFSKEGLANKESKEIEESDEEVDESEEVEEVDESEEVEEVDTKKK